MNLRFESYDEARWNQLQQPIRSTYVSSPYLLLMAALDQGWQVNEPVQHVPRNHPDCAPAYRFILLNGVDGRSLYLTIPAGMEIEHFISQEQLRVEPVHAGEC